MKEVFSKECGPLKISEQDVLEAMKRIPGYLDITPGDFKEIYQAVYTQVIQRLLTDLKAVNIMTTSVVVVDQEMALVDAAALLAEKHISGAPVVNREGTLVGVVSEKDFLREMGFSATPAFMQIATHCLNDRSCMIGRLHNKIIADIMSRPPITGAAQTTVGAISSLFIDRQINRLPIIDADQRPIGMVTCTDLAHSLNVYQER